MTEVKGEDTRKEGKEGSQLRSAPARKAALQQPPSVQPPASWVERDMATQDLDNAPGTKSLYTTHLTGGAGGARQRVAERAVRVTLRP
ncbi:hypothetical protein O3P69_020843 [Scylla paramamosain]|uniref:Uncharacterized protein n=1 Tax=Scylla paramamosain TaxID=85552 RepID=A0AAW0TMY7_SCYPA